MIQISVNQLNGVSQKNTPGLSDNKIAIFHGVNKKIEQNTKNFRHLQYNSVFSSFFSQEKHFPAGHSKMDT